MRVSFQRVITLLTEGNSFLLITHRDPDGDGVGSMLALGGALSKAGKDVVLFTEKRLSPSLSLLRGAKRIVQRFDPGKDFDAVVALDCAELARLGKLADYSEGAKPLINIDHHETNDLFGDLNLVDTNSSSTGELVFKVINTMGIPVDSEVAENLFAAIQTDTGSFRYHNTTSTSLKIAAEMMEHGVNPWEVSRKIMDRYEPSRLRLLEMALGTIEFHHEGKIGMMTLSSDMFKKANAHQGDSERFVDYPRFVSGVEIAVMIRETGENDYKFSLRSNNEVNVAQLASLFGGGGHARAAGFECHGSIGVLKEDLLIKAGWFLNGTFN